jgi:phosphoribosylamine--glycine ligase
VGDLAGVTPRWKEDAAVCVVMASGGYPGSYPKGVPIEGVDEAEARGHVTVFHAGTASVDGKLLTAGGRVLGVTALGADLAQARARAYDAVSRIRFKGAHHRTDIGMDAVRTLRESHR